MGRTCDYIVLTPTYNRPDLLELLLSRLTHDAAGQNIRIKHVIIDDCSSCSTEYRRVINQYNSPQYEIIYTRNQERMGRERFWESWNRLFEAARSANFRYAICLADDMRLCDNFIARATHMIQFSIESDPHVAAVNLMQLHPRNWATERWVDGAFIATRQFFKVLRWRVNPIPPERFQKGAPSKSSGVWQQITRRIGTSGVRIAPVAGISLAMSRRGEESRMFPAEQFPDRPKAEPKWMCNFIGGSDGNSSSDTFTYNRLREMLQTLRAAGYEFKHFPTHSGSVTPLGQVFLRHDVDLDPVAALRIAQIDAEEGAVANFFVMLRGNAYNPFGPDVEQLVEFCRTHGHRISVHIDLSGCNGNHERTIITECKRFGEWYGGIIPDIVSLHRPTPGLLAQMNAQTNGIIRHTYHRAVFENIAYFSDSAGRWSHGFPLDSSAYRERQSMQILVHPIWWHSQPQRPKDRLAEFTTNVRVKTETYCKANFPRVYND